MKTLNNRFTFPIGGFYIELANNQHIDVRLACCTLYSFVSFAIFTMLDYCKTIYIRIISCVIVYTVLCTKCINLKI